MIVDDIDIRYIDIDGIIEYSCIVWDSLFIEEIEQKTV